MTPGRMVLLTLGATATLAATGCGGSGSGGTPAPPKASYVARANAICATANAAVTSAAKRTFTGAAPTLPQIRRYAQASFFPVVERELRDLRALTPPAGDDGAAEAVFDAIERGLARARTNPVLLGLPGRRNPFTTANAQARRYGLTVCGAA